MPYKDLERQRAYQREWARHHRSSKFNSKKDRTQRVREYKLAKGCQRCGYSKSACALDIHHPNGEGKDGRNSSVANLCRRGFAWSKILAILEVCEVVCANCHREEHATVNPPSRKV